MGNYLLALTKEVNLATGSASSAEVLIKFGGL